MKANGLQCASAEAIDNEIKLHQVLLGRPHHNVVTVLGVCVDSPDGNVRLVMEYYSGGSLDSHLHRVRESGEVSLMSRSRAVHGAPDVTAVKLCSSRSRDLSLIPGRTDTLHTGRCFLSTAQCRYYSSASGGCITCTNWAYFTETIARPTSC